MATFLTSGNYAIISFKAQIEKFGLDWITETHLDYREVLV